MQKAMHEFDVDFHHVQEAHMLCRKLSWALTVLNGTVKVVEGLITHAGSMETFLSELPVECATFRVESDNFLAELRSHINTTRNLLATSDRLCALVSSFRIFDKTWS